MSKIADELSAADPALGRLLEQIGPPPRRRPIPVAERFDSLCRAILHQQLATKAAATITERTRSLAGGAFSPAALLDLDVERLRSAGVSGAKAASLHDLARRCDEGAVDLGRLSRLDDDAVIEQLVAVRGIGRWTAEMFLMGPLGRPDVWPVGDLGVRSGWALIRRRPRQEPKDIVSAADHLRPHRSSVAWACWRAVDLAAASGGRLPE